MGVEPYQNLSNSEIISTRLTLLEAIHDFIHIWLGFPASVQYTVCELDLLDAIIRVDKRQHYFQVFHGMHINECKRGALYAYWLAKLRPIKIIDDTHKNMLGYNDMVNELFAVHWMLSSLVDVGKIALRGKPGGIDLENDHPYIKELCYSFRFRNFPIDMIIVMGDSITTETFLKYDKDAGETGGKT
jgi:hypothetical protein